MERTGLLDIRGLGLNMALIEVTPQVGTPETGLWCEVCNLPSLMRYPLSGIVPSGVAALKPMDFCPEHETVPQVVQLWAELYARPRYFVIQPDEE